MAALYKFADELGPATIVQVYDLYRAGALPSRQGVAELMELAAQIPIKPEFQEYGLEEANQALVELEERKIRGVKVLRIGG